MRRTKEDAEQTRQEILKAALKIFGKKGFAATRLSDVAAEAGVTRGAIYWHFQDKKDLFVALFKEKVDPYFELVQQALKDDVPPLDRIRRMLVMVVDKMETESNFTSNQRLHMFEGFLSDEFTEIHEYMKQSGLAFFKIVQEIIETAKARGEVRESADPVLSAMNLIIFLRGMGGILQNPETRNYLVPRTEDLVDQVMRSLTAG